MTSYGKRHRSRGSPSALGPLTAPCERPARRRVQTQRRLRVHPRRWCRRRPRCGGRRVDDLRIKPGRQGCVAPPFDLRPSGLPHCSAQGGESGREIGQDVAVRCVEQIRAAVGCDPRDDGHDAIDGLTALGRLGRDARKWRFDGEWLQRGRRAYAHPCQDHHGRVRDGGAKRCHACTGLWTLFQEVGCLGSRGTDDDGVHHTVGVSLFTSEFES